MPITVQAESRNLDYILTLLLDDKVMFRELKELAQSQSW